ncbi:MAG: hypothetical protein JWQ42_3309 [Edaphobacter sp.]|jgi:hypothetical protein|nr:hypothetical protein [Edaphobacter sp.]
MPPDFAGSFVETEDAFKEGICLTARVLQLLILLG